MAPRVLRKYTGKVRARNTKAFRLFQHLPDRLQCILAEKFPIRYYPHLIVILVIIQEVITESEPYGSTYVAIDRSEVIDAKYYIANEENDVRIRVEFEDLGDIFGVVRACNLINGAYDMAFMRYGETVGEWD